MAIILKNAPKTEEGRKLNLTKEQEEQYKIVFRFDANKKELVNIEPWSAEGKYDNYCVIGPLSSYYYKTIDIEATYRVRNVIGTKDDENPYGSWIGIIELIYAYKGVKYDFKRCCLDNYHYRNWQGPEQEEEIKDHRKCKVIIGGHMTDNLANYDFKNLEYFLLLPICQIHNNPAQNDFYFKTDEPMWAVVMQKHMPVQNLQSALLSLAASGECDRDIEFDVRQYCEENNVEVKDMYFD